MRFRYKSVHVEAVRFDGSNDDELKEFVGTDILISKVYRESVIYYLLGINGIYEEDFLYLMDDEVKVGWCFDTSILIRDYYVGIGDWIVKEGNRYWCCSNDKFESLFEYRS